MTSYFLPYVFFFSFETQRRPWSLNVYFNQGVFYGNTIHQAEVSSLETAKVGGKSRKEENAGSNRKRLCSTLLSNAFV